MAETIAEKIEKQGLAGIAKVSVEGIAVDGMSIDDRIKADQYAQGQAAASKNHLGCSFRTFVPGGCG